MSWLWEWKSQPWRKCQIATANRREYASNQEHPKPRLSCIQRNDRDGDQCRAAESKQGGADGDCNDVAMLDCVVIVRLPRVKYTTPPQSGYRVEGRSE